MKPYLDALYDPTPSRVVDDPQRRAADPFELFQLASAGDFDILFAMQRGTPWEGSSAGDLFERSPLASALVDYVTGKGPTEELVDVRGEAGEEVVAAIISSVQFADAGEVSAACESLRSFLAGTPGADLAEGRAAVLVHLGLRCAELGEWTEAIESTEGAIAMLDEGGFERSPVIAERVLQYVAHQNLFAFNQYGRGRVVWSPGGPRRTFPDSVMTKMTEGLDAWMESDFNAAFADPDQRSITFGADKPERSFLAAVVRSELIGSWHWRRMARRALGRYSLRRVVGKPRGEVASGIATLVEAQDTKGLSAATRHLRRYGPLAGVAEVAGSLVAERPWGPSRVAASVAVLRQSVELLTEEEARGLAERVTSEFAQLRYPTRMTDLATDLLSLLAELARHWRTQDIHTLIADALLELLKASEDALLQQRSVRVVEALDWALVPGPTLERWRDHSTSHLDGDRGFPSRAFLEMAASSGDAAQAVLEQAYRQTGDLGLGLALLQTGALDTDAAGRLVDEAATWVRERAAEARSGVFGMYAYDNAVVLAVAAARGIDEAWPPLIEFLEDLAVPLAQKDRSLRYLRDHSDELKSSWRNEIAEAGDVLGTGSDALIAAPTTTVEAVALRLAAGGLNADEIRSEVVRGVTSDVDSERAASVRLLVEAREAVGLEATIMTLLLLTRDRHPQVRGEAGRFLSRVAHDSDPPLGARARLLEMLREPGTFVPSAVLYGIREEGLRFAELLAPCTALAEEHLSVEVRALARAVVGLQRSSSEADAPPPA